MRFSKPYVNLKRDSVEGLVEGMVSNLRWAEKRSIEERQLVSGLLGGLQEAGNRATGFFGGLLGIGNRPSSSTTAAVEIPPATTAAPPQEPTTAPAPPPPSTTEQITNNPPPPPPPATTSAAAPPPPPPPVTTSPATTSAAVTTAPVQSTSRAIAVPVTTPEAISEKQTSTLIPILESAISPSASPSTNAAQSPVRGPNTSGDEKTTAAPPLVTNVPDPSSVDLSLTLFTSTISSVRPEDTENPSTANTLTQVSSPEGDRGNITTIVVSIVVIIFGSIAILTAAYFISQRYIRRRKLAEDGQTLPPTPPPKSTKSRFAPNFAPNFAPKLKFTPMMQKAGAKLGISKNF